MSQENEKIEILKKKIEIFFLKYWQFLFQNANKLHKKAYIQKIPNTNIPNYEITTIQGGKFFFFEI